MEFIYVTVVICVVIIISIFLTRFQELKHTTDKLQSENYRLTCNIKELSTSSEKLKQELSAAQKYISSLTGLQSSDFTCFLEGINTLEQLHIEIATQQQSLNDITDRVYRSREHYDLSLREKALCDKINATRSNLTCIPYFAGIMADFETHGIDIFAQKLDWGHNQVRERKVKSIREIRREAADIIAKCKVAEYKLEYAIKMFPALADFLEEDFRSLPNIKLSALNSIDHDSSRNYLSKEEYDTLSVAERNQLALDRYWESHRKSNWQIGRDYEQYIGHLYAQKGYSVDYFGAYNGLGDLGRDLIAKKSNMTLIIQCKHWSSKKQIHENTVCQLYGTLICYCLENNLSQDMVRGVLVTNITLSPMAKRFATFLKIEVVENRSLKKFPCIKCNINRSSDGSITKIYHLPFDQQYDSCKIDAPGEFFALTVAEAEAAGFRRAYRWHSES